VPHASVGTGTGVADPAPPVGVAVALAVGVGDPVAVADGATGAAEDAAAGQDVLLGTGSGVAGFPVGLAEGALTVAVARGVADGLEDAFVLA
jgi:hypothetical protein